VKNETGFREGKKNSDNYHDMNITNYKNLMGGKLISNMPPHNTSVTDSTPYHTVQANRSPTNSARKADTIKMKLQF
jgi:hypothetical protein